MKQVKTVKGKMIDMGALMKKHEAERAVGNVPMNARGDRLDSTGKVSKTIQSVAREHHKEAETSVSVPLSEPIKNKTAKSIKKPKVEPTSEPMIMAESEKTREDGSIYLEIEYDDGTIETKEIGEL
jgi:hypothetical protein